MMSNLVSVLRDRMRMMREDAVAVAKVVEEAFAGQSELDDEALDKDLRQVFYDLQDQKVLDIRREERRIDGAARRHYLWHVRDIPLDDAMTDVPMPDPTERLYLRLGESHWERRPPLQT